MTYTLVLLRHGESEWNAKNLFTGWVDVDLTEKGARRGRRAAASCWRDAGLLPDVVHTSLLRRAIHTANLALDVADRHWIPVQRSLAAQRAPLRRAAGQGQEADARGVRRGAVHALAPLVRRPAAAARRRQRVLAGAATRATPTSATDLPRTECLKDVVARMLPYWDVDDRPRPARPAGRCWSPRTATRCARSSSTSTASATTTSPGSTSRPASRCVYELDDDLRADGRRRPSTSTPRPPRAPRPPSPTRAARPPCDELGDRWRARVHEPVVTSPLPFGLVGHGWRADFFLRVAAALPDRLRCTGVVTRERGRGRRGRAAMGRAHAPLDRGTARRVRAASLVVTSVPWAATPDVVRELVVREVAVLAETPPAPDVGGLRALWGDVGDDRARTGGGAEPLPARARRARPARRRRRDRRRRRRPGSRGRTATTLSPSCAGCWGQGPVSGCRCTVQARRRSKAPLVQGPGRAGRPGEPRGGARAGTAWRP